MPTAGTTPQAIARAMVGRDVALALDAEYTGVSAAPELGAVSAMLEVRDLTVVGARGQPVVKQARSASRPARSSASPVWRAMARRSSSRRSPVCARRRARSRSVGAT
jgi:hypothetical protein